MGKAAINFLWVGTQLGAIEQICLRSFFHHGHLVRLFSYDRITNSPAGVEVVSANEILPRKAVFRSTDGSYANFADVFRYKLLAEHGGYWADCDMLCLRPWGHHEETLICSTSETQYGQIANVFALKAPRGSQLMHACYEETHRIGDQRFTYAQTGPFLMDRVTTNENCRHFLAPPTIFNPVPWNATKYLVIRRPFLTHLFHLKNLIRRPHLVPCFSGNTVGIHLWSGMWRLSGISPETLHPRTSVFGTAQRRYHASVI